MVVLNVSWNSCLVSSDCIGTLVSELGVKLPTVSDSDSLEDPRVTLGRLYDQAMKGSSTMVGQEITLLIKDIIEANDNANDKWPPW